LGPDKFLHSQCKKRILPGMTTVAPAPDGRSARATRTRDAVVDAFLALIDDGNLRPTARQVSERAGVSLRSVFQHFADLESLFATAADKQVERLTPLATRVSPEATLEDRIALFVDARTRLLEAISPVRRAALLQAPFSEELAGRLHWSRESNRAEVARVFSPELAALPEKDRRDVLAALHAASEWYTWETLRVHDGLSATDARRVMSRMISALLVRALPSPAAAAEGPGVRARKETR
jgi:TetR/AcrR family transcriptional regulator of autoinduction and epiphytic fitness